MSEKHRRRNLKSRYGLSVEEYDRLLAEQNGVCAICHRECSTGKRLAVDHDHRTRRNRGLLCNSCNGAIGQLKEDISTIHGAIAYLIRYTKEV